MKSRFPQLCVLLALVAVLGAVFLQRRDRAGEGGQATDMVAPDRTVLDAFDAWLLAADAAPPDGNSVAEGLALARAREAVMLTLIKDDPREALARAVSFSAYTRLPEALRAHVERPFSGEAELIALPVCAPDPGWGGGSPEVVHELLLGGEHFRASVFGRRAAVGTKESAPLQGITLGGFAAVREEVLQLVDDAGLFPAAVAQRRCFATGAALGADAVVALAGGRAFFFANAAVLAAFDQRVGELDLMPGPLAGSRVVLLMADGGLGGAGGFDWEAAEGEVELQASAWTETPKDVYFIRVDFSDVPGASISQAELASLLNTTASDTIAEMSYGKTSIAGTVSPVVVRMPRPSTAYLPSDNSALHDEAKAAATAQIPGLDLGNYDIIGVHFASIGIGSGGTSSYVGLAGGARQWLQGTASSNVLIHELGHNYGLGHASFWQTSDGSVVGAGTSEEYGDDFDIMGTGANSAHFHMQAKQRLDWLGAGQWTDVTAAGSATYRVFRFDDPATAAANRGLRITKAASPAEEYYWLGHRRKLAGNRWLASGAYLVWQRPGFSRSWLLDTTPGSAAGRDDGMIVLGRTYSDNAAGVHITTVGVGGSAPDEWIDVTVNLGPFSGNSAPSASLTGPTSAVARESVTFSVDASDPDGDPLAYFWDFADATLSANLPAQSRSWAVGGTHTISVTVSDMKGGTVTKSQSVTVSDPLENWTQRPSGTAENLFDIATDGTRLVAVGASRGVFRTSTDGMGWAGGTIGTNIYLRGVTWDGSQFLAAGQNYQFTAPAGWYGAIYTSPDGSSWTERHFAGAQLRDIATSGGVHVAVGDRGEIWRSTDGASWVPIPSGTTIDLKGVSYGAGNFVAIGSGSPGNAGGPVVALTSTDGNTWQDHSAGAGTLSWQGFYDVQFCNDRFLASGFRSKIRHSTDGGLTFATTRTADEQIPGFAFGNGIYLAAGEDNGNGDLPINLISLDGETWNRLTTDTSQANRNAAVFFQNTFITVGDGGQIWQSNPFTAPPTTGSFAAWLDGYFPGATPGTAALLDGDGDGKSNLQEYASGTDPTLASSQFDPLRAEVDGYQQLTVTKNPAATDVTVRVEISTDLAAWGTAGTVVVADEADRLVVRSATLAADPGASLQFMRAVYTHAE